VFVPLLFAAVVLMVMPIRETFEFDGDEGINLMKALLYADGYTLYRDIWSDQPPLFTAILSIWLQLFGESIVAARVLVAVFAALLVWALYQTVRVSWGIVPALVSTLVLINSYGFMKLSVAVMIGLPAIALAMLAIYTVVIAGRQNSLGWLAVSGTILALSLQTKLFTVVAIPAALVYLCSLGHTGKNVSFLGEGRNPIPWRAIALWLVTICITYVLVGLAFHSTDPSQLLRPHVEARELPIQFDSPFFSFPQLIERTFGQDYAFFLLAVCGSCALFLNRQREGIIPIVWLATAIALLFHHKPVWFHHYLLLAVPIAWLAGIAVHAAMAQVARWRKLEVERQASLLPFGRPFKAFQFVGVGLVAILAIFALTAEGYRTVANRDRYFSPPQDVDFNQWAVVRELVKHEQKGEKWLFTDRPMYAFYAGLRVPPEIAVLSMKRMRSGETNPQELLNVVKKYRPDQVFLAQFGRELNGDVAFDSYLDTHYQNESQSVDRSETYPLAYYRLKR
jgi:4-amino-4-deoxy-L-arabinose transferase-like glycosyltransferase